MATVNTVPFQQPAGKLMLWRYGLAVILVGASLLATLLLQRYFLYPFLFLFFGAVMASAWFGGRAAGLVAVLLSILAVDYFFLPPVWSFAVNSAAGTYLAGFVLCALVASWVSSVKKQSEEALKEARDQLEVRVSERTAALMKTEAELARLSRVLSMGELTASIAHEIKQPLTAVVANGYASIEWLAATPPNIERARQSTERIIRDGTRAGEVINRIRALFKKEPPIKQWLDMNEIVHDLLVLVRGQALAQSINLRAELDSNLPKIKGDKIQLQQVVLNLIMNAMDAIIGSENPRRELVVHSWTQSDRQIGLRVEDSGRGLSAEIEPRIFEPFFTTKSYGIGMGLSISRSIIESHDGKLWASARPGGGAVFQFLIPVQAQDFDE